MHKSSLEHVGRREDPGKACGRPCVEGSSVQILVVVAITQQRRLRTEAEKGFISTSLGYESVGSKCLEKSFNGANHTDVARWNMKEN